MARLFHSGLGKILLVALAVAAAAGGSTATVSASSTVSFVGDWETGSYSQWGDLQYEFARPMSSSFEVVTSPVRQGRYAARFVAKQAYSPFGWKESTEVARNFSDQGQGSEYYYGLSLLFPSTWSDPYGWGLVTQFYTKTFSVFYGPPPISIDAGGNRLGLHINTGLSPIAGGPSFQWEYSRYLVIAPTLSPGQWNDIVLHVRWAANPSNGVLEVWHRVGSGSFSKVISLSGIPTLRYNPSYNGGQPDPIGIIKQGIYRNSKCNTDSRGNIGEVQAGDLCQYGAWGTQPDTVVYHDGFIRAGSFDEVAAALGSSGSTAVSSTAPANTSLPAISGTPQEGKTLTASTGTWSGSPTSYAYQWRRCDSAGQACADIAGATASSYTAGSADVGKTLRVVVTARNSAGSASATSAPTAVVQAAATATTTATSTFSESAFGKTTVGAYWDRNGAGYKDGRKAVLAEPGQVTTIRAYQRGAGGSTWNTTMRAAIYKADGSGGGPGTLVAVSGEVKVNAADPPAWRDYPFPSPVSLQAGAYWLVLHVGGSSVAETAADRASGIEAYNADAYSDGPSNPFGPASYSSSDYSIYAVYTPQATAPANTSLPAISGTPQEGKTLTASTGTWSGSPTSYAYQWRRCDSAGQACADIAGATASSYTAGSADVGKTLRVVVTARNSAGSASATSAPTAVVQAASTTTAGTTTSGFVTNVVAGSTITTPFVWTFSPGEPAVKGYFWADGKLLAAVEGPGPYTWTLPAGLLSSGSHLLGHSWDTPEGVRHAPTSAYSVTISNPTAEAPASTSPPAISGTPQEGKTLTASTGTWSGSPTSYAYQWRRCDSAGQACADIAGATASSYTAGSADVGKTLRVVVTARNSAGSASATSAPTAVVQAAVAAPQATALPTISGPTVVGKTLTASTGTWSGSPTSYAYQWRRCDSAGQACADIGGATASTYTAGSADVGKTLRVVVTATNAGGSGTAVSEPTKVVR